MCLFWMKLNQQEFSGAIVLAFTAVKVISDCNRGLWGITFLDSDGRNIRRCFSSLRLYKNALFFIYQLLIKLCALLHLSC